MVINDIFKKENNVIVEAESLLASEAFISSDDAVKYKKLLDEYKKLLRQIRAMIKMSDITQQKLSSLSNDLELQSNLDELTRLYNKRFFNVAYEKEWYKAMRSGSHLGLLMIDVDNFKRYNDTYGHLQGDECLREVAAAIKQSVNRSDDMAARFGGDEFVVLLPNTNAGGCLHVAKEIFGNVSSMNLQDTYNVVTVSIGIAHVIPQDSMEVETLLKKADEALYQAKNDGRCCCREENKI